MGSCFLEVARANPGKLLSGALWTFWKCLGLVLGRYFLEVSGVKILGRYFLDVSGVNPEKILSGGVQG